MAQIAIDAAGADSLSLGSIDSVNFIAVHAEAGWGIIAVEGGKTVFAQPRPARVERWTDADRVQLLEAGYHELEAGKESRSWLGRAVIIFDGAEIHFEDRWQVSAVALDLSRTVRVKGRASGGFATGLVVNITGETGWSTIKPFFPGIIYGSGDAIAPGALASPAAYSAGVREVRIRADRLPLPLFGLWTTGKRSITILDPRPDGASVIADCWDTQAATPRVDGHMLLSAVGGIETAGGFSIGIWFPGSEGEETYPHTQNLLHWRRRFHPISDGFVHSYQAALRVGHETDAVSFWRAAWRWAWKIAAPEVATVDIEVARQALVEVLASNTNQDKGVFGLPLAMESTNGKVYDSPKLMGFTGRNTDTAIYLLLEANRRPDNARAIKYRRLGTGICDSFVVLKMNPPEAEGFRDAKPYVWTYLNRPNLLYLRPMCEGARSLLRCWRIEHDAGRDHGRWKQWAIDFGDWLVRQQLADGSFPRAWIAKTGRVGDDSPRSTYNAVTLLTLLATETGEKIYLTAAERAGEFAWNDGQKEGNFVGGTIDNPNVIDKEAGTISLSAYLSLFEMTKANYWLDRAKQAADFAQTWVYGWNVPMPVDALESELHWKHGVNTTGVQLISTGHSLVDQYMAFDVGSYLKLSAYCGDPHYHAIARVLLHGTKAMLAMPDHTFDLKGPGWQQEHWCLSIKRGLGGHRLWLPWVSVAHLQGITDAEQFDPKLFAELAANAG